MFKAQVPVPRDDDSYTEDGIIAWGLGIAMKPMRLGIAYRHGGNNVDFQSGCLFYRDRGDGYVFFTNGDKGSVINEKLEVFLGNL